MPFPNPATQFKPGNNANPNGRPKDQSLRARIRALLQQDAGDGKTVADRLAEKFVIEALKGKFPFAHDVLESNDGKLTERVEHVGGDGGPIEFNATVVGLSSEQVNAWREQKRAEIAARPTGPPP